MSNLTDRGYFEVLNSLTEKIKNARLRASIKVNAELVGVYWEIGAFIAEQEAKSGWGKGVVDRLAKDLKIEFPDMKGLSPRYLRYMRDFSKAYPRPLTAEFEHNTVLQGDHAKLVTPQLADAATVILQAELAKLTWYHHITLLDKVKDLNTRIFYIKETAKNGWSRDVMVHQIESGLHNRQGKAITNFSVTIPEYSELAQQMFKDPFKLEFIALSTEAKERDLEDALITHITKLLLELGEGFTFKARQFLLLAGEKEFKIDLLFYHTKLRRYIVVELKIGDFKPEYVGKMNMYLGLIDDRFKDENPEPAIGLILCKTKDNFVAEYALRDTNKPMGIAEYRIHELLPADIKQLKKPSHKKQDLIRPLAKKLNSEKLTHNKNDEKTLYLFQNVFHAQQQMLWAAIKDDIAPMFKTVTHSWRVNSYVFGSIKEAEGQLLKHPSSHEFYYEIRLEGFLDAGVNTFSCYAGYKFYLDHYHYQAQDRHSNGAKYIYKKLYHQNPSHEEMIDLVEQYKMDLLNQIEENLERITKEGN